jgi:hypothetical protein
MVGHRPADDLARGHILDRGQVEPAFIAGNGGDIGRPLLEFGGSLADREFQAGHRQRPVGNPDVVAQFLQTNHGRRHGRHDGRSVAAGDDVHGRTLHPMVDAAAGVWQITSCDLDANVSAMFHCSPIQFITLFLALFCGFFLRVLPTTHEL